MEKHNDIKKELKGLEHIRLSNSEKQSIRNTLTEYISYKPVRSENINVTVSQRFWFVWMRRPMPVFAATLLFLVGGTTAVAAEGALPGDILYPIKVSVNEEVRAAFALSNEAKANWSIARAERRLEEATLLSADGRLTEETKQALDTHIEDYTNQAELFAQNTERTNGRFVALATRIEIALNARDRITRAVSEATMGESGIAALEARSARSFDADAGVASEAALFTEPMMQMETASFAADEAIQATALSKSVPEVQEQNDAALAVERIRAQTQLTTLRDRLKSTHVFVERAQRRIAESSYERAREEIARMETLLNEGVDALAKKEFVNASMSFQNALQISLDIHDIVNSGVAPIQPPRKVEFETPASDVIPAPVHLPLEIAPVEIPKRPIF